MMLRRSCSTVGTGYGLIGADRSGLLVRSVVRFARCNVLAPSFTLRLSRLASLNSWLLSSWLMLALTGSRLGGGLFALLVCCACNQSVAA
jgi:hypothetical protein